MNVHEYQAKEVLRQFGIPIPDFRVVSSKEEAKKAIEELGITSGVVKIQVHAGGRGKAGGVKLGKSKEELLTLTEQLIGLKMVNRQTGPSGIVARQVMITELTDIEKEFYVGAIIDREQARATLIVSPEGGMDIEEVAEKTPEKILTISIGLGGTLKRFQLIKIAKFMGWEGQAMKEGMDVCAKLAKAFTESDASLLEINPLVLTPDAHIVALDAKLSVDNNALYRQKGIAEMYDPTQYASNEVEAKTHDLAYIALDGNIGCMVNGAGLAMATMDIIQHYGAEPANFLDVGGGASKEKVAEGFKIILDDPKVQGILVNIFGGIMDCGVLAEGIVYAAKEIGVQVPLVVRMEGTNVEKGKAILKESNLEIITADGLAEAAKKVVECVKAPA